MTKFLSKPCVGIFLIIPFLGCSSETKMPKPISPTHLETATTLASEPISWEQAAPEGNRDRISAAIEGLSHSAVAAMGHQPLIVEPDDTQVLYLLRAARYREALEVAHRADPVGNIPFLRAKSRVLAGQCTPQSPCFPDFESLKAPDPILESTFAFWRIRASIADMKIDASIALIEDFDAQFKKDAQTRNLLLDLDKQTPNTSFYEAPHSDDVLKRYLKLTERIFEGSNSFEAASLIHIQMKLLQALGRIDEAAQKTRQLVLQYPATQMSIWPELATSASVATQYGHETRFRRIQKLIDHFDYDDARAELKLLIDDPQTPISLRNHAEWELARISLTNSVDPQTSEKIYRKWAQKKGSRREEAVFGIARALSRQQKFRETIAALEDYERQFPKGVHRMRSLYLRGWYYFELRDNASARPLLKRYAEKTNDTAVWGFYAQTLIRDENWDEAIEAFEKLKGNTNPIVRGKALYWQAYAEFQRHHLETAKALLETIHREFPLTWYDILSYQRAEDWFGESAQEAYRRAFRRESDPPRDVVFHPWGFGTAIATFPTSTTWQDIALLAQYDAIDEARKIYRQHESALLSQVPASERDEFRRYATHLVEFYNGAWEDVSGSVRAMSSTYPSRSNPRHKMAYPQPFSPLIHALSHEYGLVPYFMFGIMLQESRFRPWQVSSADAIGALQMIPKTARPIAKALGVTYHPDTFFDPRVGFPYSAYYMHLHDEKWHHNLAFTAGSYNGGPHRIGPWALRDKGKTIDFIVDEFSYDESRHYARKVVEHTLRFAYLYARSTDEWIDVVNRLVPRHVPEIEEVDDWGL